MPNWTTVSITQKNQNIPPIIREFIVDAPRTDEGEIICSRSAYDFDFNKAIPMPESLNIESGSRMDAAIVFFLTDRLTKDVSRNRKKIEKYLHSNIFYKDNWIDECVNRIKEYYLKEENAEVADELYEMGKQYVFNIDNYGYPTWYEWCCDNWGTKWNACDTWYDPEDPYCVSFMTAWSAPYGVMEKIGELYPDVELYYGISNEGDNQQYLLCRKGKDETVVAMYDELWDDDTGETTLWKVVREPFYLTDPETGKTYISFDGKTIMDANEMTDEDREALFDYCHEQVLPSTEEYELYRKYFF